MKLCIIGKYPPIQGGVSTQSYWLAHGLARRGHEIHYVTNAEEVEPNFRMEIGDDDWEAWQPRFPDSGGSVTVYCPEPFTHERMGHIPQSNPFVTRLASVATDAIRRHQCERILAFYYEPYGMAGWIASKWTGRPLSLKHAGSDLDRLFAVPDLATAYREILRDADSIITQPRLMHRFLGMGIAQDRLRQDPGFSIPREIFNPEVNALDVDATAAVAPAQRQFDPGLPTVGTLGKIGQTKGTFDLIGVLGKLAAGGRDFQFLAMVGAAQGEALRPHLERAGLADRTWILPLLPNWKVPAMLRACTLFCFIERDFPVAIHGPMVPREALACGVCLVLSGEIAGKQRYRHQLVSGENVVIVDDPKQWDTLARALDPLIVDSDHARSIGARGALLSASLESEEKNELARWEELLSPGDKPGTGDGRADALERVAPGLIGLVRHHYPGLVEDFFKTERKRSPFSDAIAFCDFALAGLHAATDRLEESVLADALRYCRARLTAAHHAEGAETSLYAASNRLNGRKLSSATAREHYPLSNRSIAIERFDYDLSSLFVSGAPTPEEPIDLSAIERQPGYVLFQRTPNLAMCELRIDEQTTALIGLCDGTRSAAEIVAAVENQFGGTLDAAEREVLADRVHDALDTLYRARVIVFAERRPEIGWRGGPR